MYTYDRTYTQIQRYIQTQTDRDTTTEIVNRQVGKQTDIHAHRQSPLQV